MTEIHMPRSVTDLVYDALRQKITIGEIQPGPITISSLAQQFNLSPPPVREALRRLEAEGFVTFSQHRRVYVNDLSAEDLREIFDMRLVMEPMLLQRAMPTLSASKDIQAQLATHIETMDEAIREGNYSRWRETNGSFHLLMYDHASAPRMRRTVGALWSASEPYLRIYATLAEALEQAQREHVDLLNYIGWGDSTGAMALLREHLATTLEIVYARLTNVHNEHTSDTDVTATSKVR